LTQPVGLDGTFKRSMISCFDAMAKKMNLIVDYCDVFIEDPLIEWIWGSRKQLN
jgi:DNA-dependent protein kinase catalytic subunit